MNYKPNEKKNYVFGRLSSKSLKRVFRMNLMNRMKKIEIQFKYFENSLGKGLQKSVKN